MPKIYGGLVEQRGNEGVTEVCYLFNSVGSILYLEFFFLVYKRQTYNSEHFFCPIGIDDLRNRQLRRVVARTSNLKISRRHLEEKCIHKECSTCITIIFFVIRPIILICDTVVAAAVLIS